MGQSKAIVRGAQVHARLRKSVATPNVFARRAIVCCEGIYSLVADPKQIPFGPSPRRVIRVIDRLFYGERSG